MTPARGSGPGRRLRGRSLGVAAALLAVLAAAPARAQTETETAPAPAPPVAQGSTEVPYPSGAEGDAAVVLELVVDVDGTVSSVTVVDGVEPFAEQARRAAAAWRFTPGHRADTPVAARIRARVDFHHERPPPPAPPAQPPPAPAPATEPPPAPEAPIDVTVMGRPREVGQTTISAADVREMPGAFGDPFRAIEALPGVTPLVSGLPYFFIRGAPPNDNAYYIDGIRVPLLFHIGIGQGVIHPGLVERVDFFPGAAPARHGGVVGAVIAGETRDPGPTLRGEANLRLIDAGGLVESPLGNGRGNLLVAGRYGYPGPILGAITPGLSLGYWDYQARAGWRITDRDAVGIFAFGSHDYFATPSPSADPTARPIEQFLSDFHRIDLRYDHALAGGRIRFALTGGHDRQGASPSYVTDRSAAARLEADARLASALRIRAGASARLDVYGFTQNPTGPGEPPIPSTADPPPTNVTAGGYADVVWQLGPRIELTPGVRFDMFASSRASAPGATTQVRTTVPAFDPRLAARVTIAPALAWLSTVGTAHQFPALRVGTLPAPIVTVPGFPFGEQRLQAVVQASQGLEVRLPADVVVTATGFLSRWSGLTDLTEMCVQTGDPPLNEPPPYQCPSNQLVEGHAYGLELLARRPLSKRVTGWLSYTLSRSIRDAHFITPAGGDDLVTVPSEADRRHVLNAILAYEPGRRWRFGARFLFYTGAPYSQTEGAIAVPPYNAYRDPHFFRLDVRVEKRWSIGKSGSIALVVEGLNVTLSTETSGQALDCMGSPGASTQCSRETIGPITIPSVGVEAVF